MQITSAPDGTILINGKVVTALDRFVASVTEIIKRYTDYVIVSGYVAILFGRARGTEDIDLFIDYVDKDMFRSFFEINPLILRLRRDARRAILFGSAATGEDTDESDIDLFIETVDMPGVVESVATVQAVLDREISPIILTPGEFRSLKARDQALYECILGGRVVIEEHDEVSV